MLVLVLVLSLCLWLLDIGVQIGRGGVCGVIGILLVHLGCATVSIQFAELVVTTTQRARRQKHIGPKR